MKIIDLLNKIANEEEVPLEIKCYNKKYRYDSLSNDYEQIGGFSSLFKDLLIINGFDNLPKCLNDEVEILEEKKITPKDFENLGYALGSIKKYINKGYDKAIEEKKILEKLDYVHPDISCSYNESELLLRIEANKDKINEIIDYLKSKGE